MKELANARRSWGTDAAAFGLSARIFRLRMLAFKAGYRPDQPRVPAGNPDGGQWTGTGSASSARQSGNPAPRNDGVPRAEVSEHTTRTPDGVRIRSQISKVPTRTGWNERHIVRGRNGLARTFVTNGNVQSVLDESGALLSKTEWTADGPARLATVQPANALVFVPFAPIVAEKTVEAGILLFGTIATLLSLSGDTPKEQQKRPVIAFRARNYQSGDTKAELDFVGALTEEEVGNACPKLGEVQRVTNSATLKIDAAHGSALSAQTRGTFIHTEIKSRVNALNDPNFRAEVSVLKSLSETYGKTDSVRVDIFEDVKNGTVCVYDIKTGKAGLTPKRMEEIARKVRDSYGPGRDFIVIEIRPTL